jgi:hypothetical protein
MKLKLRQQSFDVICETCNKKIGSVINNSIGGWDSFDTWNARFNFKTKELAAARVEKFHNDNNCCPGGKQ